MPPSSDASDLIAISRARLREVVDAAVERGRIARADADRLVDELLAVGRTPGDAGRSPDAVDASFPISRYDDLTAAEVVARLDGMSAADLRAVGAYERANANRKAVLEAVERKLA